MFLLSFHYKKTGAPDEERHVLIDCGSTAPPRAFTKAKKSFSLVPVAEEIKRVCAGKLQAVVATHRHRDHISGFTTETNGKGPGAVLASLQPNLVLQPWTEDPELPTDAQAPKSLRHASGRFALGLQGMHQFSAGLLAELSALRGALSPKLLDQLGFLGENNLKNLSAVKNLMGMGKNEYLYYGAKTGLQKLLPGVTVKVLGPPTLEQNQGIAKQRSRDAAEFWQLRGAAASAYVASAESPFARSYRIGERAFPPEVRWIIPRIQASRAAQLLELVRILDDQMNNTSLVLLFEAGGKKLLFPGDAQIENWNHALREAKDAEANRKLLAGTDFYKVGHHGSLNATPKTLWGLFKKKAPSTQANRLQTMISTRPGKHGDSTRKTEVPRLTLLAELEANSLLFNTDKIPGTKVKCHVATVTF